MKRESSIGKIITGNIHQLLQSGSFTLLQPLPILCLRSDGIVLFQQHCSGSAEALGALMTGASQACRSLTQFFDASPSSETYRFFYGASNKGISILELKILGQQFFLGLLYEKALNPAKLRRELERFAHQLEVASNQVSSAPQESNKHGLEKQTALFEDLSDSELNELFSFMG